MSAEVSPSGTSRINPLTRIFIMLIITTPLLLSLDWVSATMSLSITILAALLLGVGPKRIFGVL